jgi:glucan phosphoethanolaminetransferase (alkaline phosphatase superfamily)
MADHLHMSPATPQTGAPAPERRYALITSALLIWLVTSVLTAWFEFTIFWNLPLLLFTMNLSTFDQVLVVWSLWARILLVTSPAIAVIAFSHHRGSSRWLRCVGWVWHFFVLAWLVIDSGLQCVTGASFWHYVEKAMVTEDLSLGGDVTAITEGVQQALWITGVRIAMIFVVSHFAFRAVAASRFRHALKTMTRGTVACCVVVVAGIVGAREFVQQQPALEQLYGTIAFPAWLFHPDRIAQYGTAAFGKDCTEEFSDVAADLHRLTHTPAESAAATTLSALDRRQTLRTASLDHAGLLSGPQLSTHTLRPNIVVLLTESIRYDAFCEQHTPRLNRWKERGLVAEQHYTNSNCSEFGAFACMYSQFPLCYDETLDKQIPSAPCTQLKELGYQRQLIASCSVNFCRMNEFLGPLNFDRTSIHSPKGNPWHDNDNRTLSEIATVVQNADAPQFVFSILMATHYAYDYPPAYDLKPPACVPPLPQDPTNADVLRDRYWKALAFLDERLDQFLTQVADTNTIVAITGDHGESFLDDGFLCHGTRLSDIQSRTPLIIIGPGVPVQRLQHSTGHVDLLPTLLHLVSDEEVPVAHSHGKSLLTVSKNRSQLLTQAHTNYWEVLLVNEAGRLAVKVPRNSKHVSVMGFFDSNGRVDLNQQRDPDQIAVWKQRFKDVVAADPQQ